MRLWKVLASALVVAAPALLASAPAEALTAKQYQHQGRGVYLNSTGSRKVVPGYRAHRYHRYHHRHMRRHSY